MSSPRRFAWVVPGLVLAGGLVAQDPATTRPVPSEEDRAAAAGWRGGGDWMDQHEAIALAGRDGDDVDVILLGDSITQSWGGEGRDVWGPGAAAAARWFDGWRVVNGGISGDRTQHLLWRLEHGAMDGIAPAAVVVMIGTNNLPHDDAADIVEGIVAVVATVRRLAPSTAVVLVDVPPRGPDADDPMRRKAADVNARLRERDLPGVTRVDLWPDLLLPDGATDPARMSGDHVHLNEAGYDAMGARLRPVLEAALARPRALVAQPLPATARAAIAAARPAAHVMADPAWHVWGGSMIADDTGRFHLFYARWPRADPRAFRGWLYASEIARATSDRPEGPYELAATVLAGRGGDHWDAVTAHNPHVRVFDGVYHLYYIATRDGDHRGDDWQDHQYMQRIGVATAPAPSGPWARRDAPIVEPQPDGAIHHYVTNPSVCRTPDGRYLMLLKGKTREDAPRTIHGVAFADAATGPFVIRPEPLLTEAAAEDPFVWYDETLACFRAVFKDWDAAYAGGGIALIESADGVHWRAAPAPLVSPRSLRFDDGTELALRHLERPQVWLDGDGSPRLLFAAAAVDDPFAGARTFNVHLPLGPAPR